MARAALKHPAHGRCAAALLLIDFISEWDIAERRQLLPQVEKAASAAARGAARCR